MTPAVIFDQAEPQEEEDWGYRFEADVTVGGVTHNVRVSVPYDYDSVYEYDPAVCAGARRIMDYIVKALRDAPEGTF